MSARRCLDRVIRLAQRDGEAGAQPVWRGEPRHARPDCPLPAALRLDQPRALGAVTQMRLERIGLIAVELAVGIGLDEAGNILADHFTNLGVTLPRAARCSFSRARARRDMTVPIGKASTSAISR